jgi:opine dehydrogenase
MMLATAILLRALSLATCAARAQHLPVLAELGTLTYGTRAKGNQVQCSVKVRYVNYATLPSAAVETIGPNLERLFPGLRRVPTVLAAGLTNANPVIHPAITMLNIGAFENKGSALKLKFYKDGVSPMVARQIEAVDKERMALLRALGYPAMTDAELCAKQGYAEDGSDYYRCYGLGTAFGTFDAPPSEGLSKHRYFMEDCGQGLVLYTSLGKKLGVPTPLSEATLKICAVLTGTDFLAEQARTCETLGLHELDLASIRAYLETGKYEAS